MVLMLSKSRSFLAGYDRTLDLQRMLLICFCQSKRFFDQPIELKNEVMNPPGPKPQRGYTGVGIEFTSKLHKDEKIRAMSDAKVRPH
jgi:hypothetical protein